MGHTLWADYLFIMDIYTELPASYHQDRQQGLWLRTATIRADSKGHDSELPASYHLGKAMIDRAGREEAAERFWKECGSITPQVIDSIYLIDSDILSQCCMGQ